MDNNTNNNAVMVANSNMSAMQICTNTDAINKLGATFAASGFFGAVSQSGAIAALVNCFIEGLSPIQYRAKYHTMGDGTTTIKSDFMQREFHRLGGKWKFNEWTSEVCDITFAYDGQELRGRVTLAEFRANGVACGKDGKTLKTNWAKFPKEMLKARCMATYIRALCPEALGGLYTQEEAQEFTAAPNVPPKTAPVAAPEVVVEAEVVDAPPPPAPDYAVCPCGRSKGKRFDSLPTDTLERILESAAKYPAIADGHRAEISRILVERENAEDNNNNN